MVNFDKFLASFITEIKKYQPITSYNIPGCIKKALVDQGLDYKGGEIIKTQCRISAEAKENGYGESKDERIRKAIIEGLREMKSSFLTISSIKIDDAIAWLEKQGEKIQQTPQWMIDFLNENRVKFASLMEDYDDQREAEGKLLAIIDWLEKKGK